MPTAEGFYTKEEVEALVKDRVAQAADGKRKLSEELTAATARLGELEPQLRELETHRLKLGRASDELAAAPYRNAALPVPARVADLLARMTPAEKVAQLWTRESDARLDGLGGRGLRGVLNFVDAAAPLPTDAAARVQVMRAYYESL